jgi:Tat protein secretion system quality control protein TatD with DNase activity
LSIAFEHKKPVVVHSRKAAADTLQILKETVSKVRKHQIVDKEILQEWLIHLHGFTDTGDDAKKFLMEFPNLFFGLNGILTYKTATTVRNFIS